MRFLFLSSFILISSLIVLPFTACSSNTACPPEGTLSLELPAWPPEDSRSAAYPPLSRWLIQVTSAEAQYDFYTTAPTVAVPVKTNRPLCVSAYPITLLEDQNECSYFLPAGYLYPTAENQKITWEQGFLADTMQKLFNEGKEQCLPPVDIEYLISTFNWKKAQKSIEEKLISDTKLFYNPWLLSQSSILDEISSHNFKSSLLNLTGTAALEAEYIQTITGLSKENSAFFSSFVPENKSFLQKKQFTVLKNSPILISDAKKVGLFITYKSSKNISLEYIYLPIYIGDI